MADLTYAQLKQAWLDNAKGTPYDNNDWASTMAAVAQADKSTAPVSADGVAQLQTQGAASFDSYQSGAYKAFVNTATSPSPPPITPGILGRPGQPGSSTGGTAGEPTAGQQASASASSAGTASDCAWSISPFSGGGLLQDVLGHPSWCVLSWSQVRALASTGILLGGGLLFVFAVGTLLAATAPGQAIGRAGARLAGVAGMIAVPEIAAPAAAAKVASKAPRKSPSPSGRAPKPVAGAGPLSGKSNREPAPSQAPAQPRRGGRTQQGVQPA